MVGLGLAFLGLMRFYQPSLLYSIAHLCSTVTLQVADK